MKRSGEGVGRAAWVLCHRRAGRICFTVGKNVKHSGPPVELDDPAIRYSLAGEQHAQLLALLERIENDERAPTSVRERERALEVHVADSLVALEVAQVRSARSLADIGAGAGLPGVVLAIALPGCEVALVESQGAKCAFMEGVLVAAGVGNARVVCARVEEWDEGTGANDVVTARALAPQPVVLEYAAPLLRQGGVVVDWRGRRDAEEEERAARAAAELGLERVEVRRVEPYAGVRDHHLHLFRKLAPTPARYPRRAGVARKRPLGR